MKTDNLPDGVPLVADFNHEYNRLDYYHPRLVEAGVPVPETQFFDIEVGDPMTFDEGAVSEFLVGNGWRQAFVRGMYASAKLAPREGSHLNSQDRDDIRRTVTRLLAQHIMMERPLGGRIAVRERIDLEYCTQRRQDHHDSEVRYFIRDGEVLYRGPPEETFEQTNLDCDNIFGYVEDDMRGGIEYPDHLAEVVASEFDELAWSCDFARDAKSGEWYCIDMGLDGLYWNETTEEWVSISGHWDEDHSPERLSTEMSKHLRQFGQ